MTTTTFVRPLRHPWPTYQQALAHSVPHAGWRDVFSGPYVVQEEPCGSISCVRWPEGDVCRVVPVPVPLDEGALRGRRWVGVVE